MHAKAMLFIDHGEREVAEFDLLLEQGMGADQHVDVAERELREDVVALASTFATGEDGNVDAGGSGEWCHGVEVLARQNFGRRHQRGLPTVFDHGRRRQQGHHGLARSYVALQQPQHALGLGKIGHDVGDGARLRRRERVGKRGDELLPQLAGARGRPPGGPAQMRAH